MMSEQKLLQKVLIANRGEIALRILRACKELKIPTTAVFSEADRELKHVKLATDTVCIGPRSPLESYLNIPSILSACEVTGADSVHPGYGFLSENAAFASRVEECGIKFIGPKSEVIAKMGNKVEAIKVAKKSGLPTIPGSDGVLGKNPQDNHKLASKIGYPVIIKASAGGGGRGMRVVESPEQLDELINTTRLEAKNAFGNGDVYLEKFLTKPRHVEVQVLCDSFGNVLILGDRDCSMQRNHQKIIEEAPAPNIPQKLKEDLWEACRKTCLDLGYEGAGTFEFLFEDNEFYFIEMNTRVQVEHPVTEMITGIDIVKEQLLIAAGNALRYKQKDIFFRGNSIECRINAENPYTFFPSPGEIQHLHFPGGAGIRVDSHLYTGYSVPPYYDSLIAKIITRGNDRESAISKMRGALTEAFIAGIDTNIPLHSQLLETPEFEKGGFSIHFLKEYLERFPS